MRRMVCADLKRILAKPGLYASVILMLLVMLFKDAESTPAEMIDFYRMIFNIAGLTIVCIPIFLSVYSDELKSGTMITAIGMGMARRKIILVKLRDCLILLLGSYIILYLGALANNCITELPITPRQNAFLFLYCMFCVIRGMGIFALSSLVLFLTMSQAGGMLTLILAGVAAPNFLKGVQDYTDIPFYNISYIGLLDSAYADFQNGAMGGTLIIALIYLAIVIALNIKLFDRKELEL